jgi:spore germination protein YaaH
MATHIGRRPELIRYGTAAAFLVAVTIAALLIRAGLNGADRASTTPAARSTRVTESRYVPPSQRRYYRVRNGDTLAAIALHFHTSVSQLERLNPKIKATALYIHYRLRVK